jgi:hypothetical protein
VLASALGALGLGGECECEPPEETTGLRSFWFSCQFLFTALALSYVQGMSYWLRSRFRAPAASRQIGIVIEKSNPSLALYLGRALYCLQKQQVSFIVLRARGLIFRNAYAWHGCGFEWLREQGINLQRKENNGL